MTTFTVLLISKHRRSGAIDQTAKVITARTEIGAIKQAFQQMRPDPAWAIKEVHVEKVA
jgi:hypothetical protein